MVSGDSQTGDLFVESLTKREKEILTLLVDRLSNREIAEQLTLAISSVKWYTRQIYRKLGVNNRSAAARRAKTLGLLDKTNPPSRKQSFLPVQITTFIGRETEIHAVEELLMESECRLLTMTGPGGIGKTRLALQIAGKLLKRFQDGVYFIDLAPISRADLIATTIAKELGLQESSGKQFLENLKDFLHDRQLLLLLDNFEHVIDAAPLITELLKSSSNLKILVTSRETLKLYGERIYEVPPLPLPPIETLESHLELNQYTSILLFLQRAKAIKGDLKLTGENASIIAGICIRLDGLPLALELAAAHLRIFPLKAIFEQLSYRFEILGSGPRDVHARQQTLRATFDWSYSLLDDAEKKLFARLAIFRGFFSLEAVEHICGNLGNVRKSSTSELEHENIAETLYSLVEKSIVIADSGGQVSPLFRLLETLRMYGEELLNDSGEADNFRFRHATYYLNLAEKADPAIRGSKQSIWLSRLQNEHNNLEAALQWSLDNHEAEIVIRLSSSLWFYWWFRGYYSEGRDWLEKALSLTSPQPTTWRANALNGAGVLARDQGDFDQARVYLEESLQIHKDLENWAGIANVLNSIGVLAQFQGDIDKAFEIHREALGHRRKSGDTRGQAISLNNLAMVMHEKGNFSQVEELYRDSMSLFQEVDDARGMAAVLLNWGHASFDQKESKKADGLLRKSLEILRDLGQRSDIIECLEGLAGVAVLFHQPNRGARLLFAAQAFREEIGSVVAHYHLARHQNIMISITDQLDSQSLESERAAGEKMSWEEAIEYALN